MQTEPDVILALLAVRMLGDDAAPANSPSLKPIKALLKKATGAGLLSETKTPVTSTTKAGKTTTKQVPAFAVTEAGWDCLKSVASRESVVADNFAFIGSLKQSFLAEYQQLRLEIQNALAGEQKKTEKYQKDLQDISRKLAALVKAVEGFEKNSRQGPIHDLLDRIDQCFQAFDRRLAGLAPNANDTPAGSVTEAPGLAERKPESIEAATRTAYDKLRHFVEYRDGLVEIPHLYNETRKSLPELKIKTFHDHLLRLWDERKVELHVLNEVREAKEPDKAIHKDDSLYYYLFWK